MNKIKELYREYNIDRFLGILWILPFMIEFLIFRYLSTETVWLPLAGFCFFALCMMRAAKIQQEEGHLPTWFLIAGTPGFLVTFLWVEHFLGNILTSININEFESIKTLIIDIINILPFGGFIASSICLAFCAGKLLETCYSELISGKRSN